MSNRSELERALAHLDQVVESDLTPADASSLRNAETRLRTIAGHQPVDPHPEPGLPVPPPPPPPPPVPAPVPPPAPDPVPPPAPAPAPAPGPDGLPTTRVFFSDWTRGPLGCTVAGIVDGTLPPGMPVDYIPPDRRWDDAGPRFSSLIADPEPVAQIVDLDGRRYLQVIQVPGNQNGTDVRCEKMQLPAASEYLIEWVERFAPDYVISPGDHKSLILISPGPTQNVYAQFRGNDDGTGRPLVAVMDVGGGVLSDRNIVIRPGNEYRFRLWIKAGSDGAVRMWVNDQECRLTLEAGTGWNPQHVAVGSVTGLKIDTTYNRGDLITRRMRLYYGPVAVYTR